MTQSDYDSFFSPVAAAGTDTDTAGAGAAGSAFETPEPEGRRRRPKTAKKSRSAGPDRVPEVAGAGTLLTPAAKPSAWLVPRYIVEREKAKKTLSRVTIGSAVAVLAIGAATLGTLLMAHSAQNDLEEAQATQAAAQARVDELAPVVAYFDELERRQVIAISALRKDLDIAGIFASLDEAASVAQGSSVSTTSLSSGTACQGGEVFARVVSLGCLGLDMEAASARAIGSYVSALTEDETSLVDDAFTTSIIDDGNSATSQVTVNFTPQSLSLRYVPESMREQVLAEVSSSASTDTAETGIAPTTTQPTAGTQEGAVAQ